MNSPAQMVAHMGWADRHVLDALRGANPLDPKLLELFGHLLGAEHIWHARLVGAPPTVAVWPKLSLDQCAELASDTLDRLTALVAQLGPHDESRAVTYINSAGDTFTSTVAEILIHVAMHGSYHRGQIASALRAAGQTPTPTDYIAFTRGAPTATRRDPIR
jgi:uncharacterized damage-inducible protein DinB